jgi:hypothetical protein
LVFTTLDLPVNEFKWSTPEGLKPYSMSPDAYKTFESSPGVLRGFCKECGSSLSWYDTKQTHFEVLIGSVDDIRAADLKITKAVLYQFTLLTTVLV